MFNPLHPANQPATTATPKVTGGDPYTTSQGSADAYTALGLDPHGNNEAWGVLRRFLPGLVGEAGSAAKFGASLEPQRQAAIQQFINYLSSAGQQAQLAKLQRGNTEQGVQGANQANLLNRSMGLGDGFNAGTSNQFLGQASRANGQAAMEYASPEHHMQSLQAILQAISEGRHNDAYDQIAQLGGFLEQRHNANQAEMGSGSFLSSIAPIAGMALGMSGGPAGMAGMFAHGASAAGGFGGGTLHATRPGSAIDPSWGG